MSCQKTKHSYRRESIIDPSEEDFQVSVPVQEKSEKNSHQDFQSLYFARDRFCQFVNDLGQGQLNQIRQDILSHCQQNSKKERISETYMSHETILKMMNLRIQKMIKNKRIKKNWSQQDVQILIWIISKYADKKGLHNIEKQFDSEDWEAIASIIPGVTGQSCMFKWLSLKKVHLATNNWSEDESSILAQLVADNNLAATKKDAKYWKLISQKLYQKSNSSDKIFRNAKQCRQHWNCFLNPNLKKGPWTPEEDIQLFKCIKQNNGEKKWSEMVKFFDGRTQNALKNRYSLIMDKQKKQNKHKSEQQIMEQYLMSCYVDQFTTEIKSPSTYEDIEESVNPFEQYIKDDAISLDERLMTLQNGQFEPSTPSTPTTLITSVKIQKFGQFLSFMSTQKIDLHSIQLGTLNIDNGIFQKTEVDEKTSFQQPISFGKLHLKKYSSSVF